MFCHRCGAAITLPATYCSNCGAPVPAAAPEAVAPAIAAPAPGAALVYSGFWRRFWASFVDGMLLNIAMFPISLMLSLPAMPTYHEDEFSPEGVATLLGTYMTAVMASIVIGWLYFALLESSPKRATVGKMALGIQVCDLAGGRLSFGRATGRHFASYVSNVTLLIGYLMVLWTAKRQALHDLIAGTLVVRAGR